MYLDARTGRSFRRSRKKGVSPIIATILLVAITVVLAAVLYVLISGLTHGPGNTPIGGAFTAGNPVAGVCSSAQVTAHICSSGHQIYTLTIESSTVTFGSVEFQIKNSGGTVLGNAAQAEFAIVTSGGVAAAWQNSTAGSGVAMTSAFVLYSATPATSSSTPLTSVYTIVVDLGTTTSVSGAGDTFNAVGIGSYSGTTAPITLP